VDRLLGARKDRTKAKDKFYISNNAVNRNNRVFIKKLFGELRNTNSEEDLVPMFKQNCLVEYILD
jgi:hypothetical protein